MHPSTVAVVSTVVVGLSALGGGARAGDQGWQRVADRDGIVVEGRDAGDSSLREVRATTHSPLAPAAIMVTLWKQEEYVGFVPHLKHLEVLRDDGDTKLIYQQFRVPLAKDRDSTVRVTRAFSPATGVHEMASVAVPEEGPPERDDHVRVRTSAGRWQLAPAADGGTDVTYTMRTDAGGLLPGWIVNTAQKNATADYVRAILERTRQRNP